MAGTVDSQRSPGARVVVVDDDEALATVLRTALSKAAYNVRSFSSGQAALTAIGANPLATDVVLCDLHMPQMDGLQVLRRVREQWPEIPVVMMTGDTDARSAVGAMRLGAYDYLVKPFGDTEEMLMTVARAVQHKRLADTADSLQRQLEASRGFEGIVGSSPAMRQVFELIATIAPTNATTLILGESGTGKELVGRALHTKSLRSDGPFVAVNCSALSDTLLESELFGHVKGAFTGASSNRRGLFQEAAGGTLFLDEIGDISPALQVRLLRALQEGEVKPVGASEVQTVDVRVVAATNRDLAAAMAAGTFREDLYYRLNVVVIEVPPLRDRPDDVALLARHFLQRYAAKYGRPVKTIQPEALSVLQGARWSGNVRELENAVQRAVLLSTGPTLTVDLLPASVRVARSAPGIERALDLPFAEAKEMAISAFERSYIEDLLTRTGGNLAEAARRGGLDKSNFRRIIRRHNVDPGRFRRSDAGA